MESSATKLRAGKEPAPSSPYPAGSGDLVVGLLLGIAAGAAAALVISGLVSRLRRGRLRLLEMEAPDMGTIVGEVPQLLSEALEAIEAGTEAVGEIVERTAEMTKSFYQTAGELKGTVFDYESGAADQFDLPNIDEHRIYQDNPPSDEAGEEAEQESGS